MKKLLLRGTVFLLTFVITLVVASRILNKNRDNLTMEMAHATLPVITMLWGDVEYNPLYGYVSAMDPSYQRDQITILGENRAVSFRIRTYGRSISKISAQLRSGDGSRLIETMDVDQYQKQGDEILAELALKDLIEQGQEYVLSIGLEMDGWQQAWYHTRATWDPESLLGEDMAFVLDFHEKLYHREEAKSLVKYLESNSRLESNDSFHRVNIHSSFKQITWGDLQVTETRKPVLTLREIRGRDAALTIDYGVSTPGTEQNVNYRVREFFQIRYSPDRTYLLSYERTMTQIPDEEALYAGDKILLGIGDENVDMMESEDGSVLAFQQADRLFSYQVGSQRMVRLFSFYDWQDGDAREEHDEHDVKILSVESDGSVEFAVWGYMNRGEREGEVGIRICRYDAKINTISEIAFIPWDKPYSNLKAQLKELLYLGREQLLYLYLEHAVYRCDLEEKSYEIVLEDIQDDGMKASEDNRILTWLEPAGGAYSGELHVLDLAENTMVSFKGGYGEKLKILGFMGHDVIYGVARTEEITRSAGGRESFPMYKLCIARADGTILKEYEQEGIYVTDCDVEENQIILERAVKKEDGSFAETTQDHVTRTAQTSTGKNQIAIVEIDTYEKYVQIKVNGKMDAGKVQLLTPKEVIREGREYFAMEINSPVSSFSVYGPKGMEGSFTAVRNAVAKANAVSGYVVSDAGAVLWRKSDRSTRNQIMAIGEPEKVSPEESLAVCLDTMLRQRGISLESARLLQMGQTPLQILKNHLTEGMVLDLTETNLDSMLYYVSRDIPVLAILDSGEGVLITGYNESQVVIFEPATGKLYKRGMSDASKWFEENGNCFLTFFP